MIDSLEKLAQSCTFTVVSGVIRSADDAAGARRVVLEEGTLVDSKYKIKGLIGRGGMGAIYRADHVHLNKEVALKTFLSSRLSDDSWQRFQLEAKAIARLQHKNIVHVFDFGIAEDNLPYYTMELLTGRSLAEEIKKSGKLDLYDALVIFSQVADALAHAHRQSIVHRDIKPANIFLVDLSAGEWLAKLVDFGVAKLAAGVVPDNAEKGLETKNQFNTMAGSIFGSPLYMSPEQSLGLPTDQRTDMYSFGCALFEAISGHPPFVGKTAMTTIMCHQTEAAPSLAEHCQPVTLPGRLEGLMARLLAKNPEQRFKTFEEIVQELETCKQVMRSQPSFVSNYARRQEANGSGSDARKPAGTLIRAGKPFSFMTLVVASIVLLAAAAGLILTKPELMRKVIDKSPPAGKPAIAEVAEPADEEVPRPWLGDRLGKDTPVDTKSFYAGETKGSAGPVKVFRFPADEAVGRFEILGGDRESVPCKGEVTVPAQARLTFFPDPVCLHHPELLRSFGDNNLVGISFDTLTDPDERHIEALSKIVGLEELNISKQSITGKELQMIGNFKSLKRLRVGGFTGINGKKLAALPNLLQLDDLGVDYLSDLSPLWQALAKGNSRLSSLRADDCNFSHEDLANIGKLKHLRQFTARHSNIFGKDLAFLAPGSALEALELQGNPIDGRFADTFLQFKKLRALSLSTKSNFSPQQWQHLSAILGANHCTLVSDDHNAADAIDLK